MEGAEGNTRRIVLLGKTESGKSSLANTLFGEKDTFKERCSANSMTKECMSRTTTINGRSVQLIDTPGFFDTDLNSEELNSEILKCIVECAPGPHAFLLVLKVERYTKQEEAVVDQMVNEYFGKEALKYTTVVFTHGNQLDEGMKIEDWLKNKSLKNLVDKCGGRSSVIDNTYWNKDQKDPYSNNQNQIKQLLETIDQTVRENRGGCYTNEMLQKKREEKKAEIKQSSPNISEESLNERAKEGVLNFLKSNLKGLVIGAILGALLGGPAGVAICLGAGGVVTCLAAGAGVGGAVGAAVGGLVGAVIIICSTFYWN
uniref:AIG1-type G domain-containing protein n=1 Tax=Neogobius melanostomus TaxID=47308 RepID=A0A8C6WF38_9GOBI